jgi:hypothetical protein
MTASTGRNFRHAGSISKIEFTPGVFVDERYVARFWNRVAVQGSSDCWLWKGCFYKSGYGQFSVCVGTNRYKTVKSNRFAYASACGPIPPKLFVLHSCDTRGCCNPAHLRLGTHEDNMRDMVARCRAVSPKRKLTMRDARAIRALVHRTPIKQLARKYGVTKHAIQWIVRGINYRERAQA